MTTPRYPSGCVEESQVRGEALLSPCAWAPDNNAWIVNFNNGNVNNNNRNNTACVRAVRSVSPPSEYQGVTLQSLYNAWANARQQKKPSHNQIQFDTQWLSNLLQLQEELNACTWQPRPTTCFIATRPKAREIHAPDFADRVVHHWLVPQIEALFEPGFIFDSYANRKSKGTHAAVDRLKQFIREVHSGQCGGYYLQLDVHNFFNSIHRPTLWALLKAKMAKSATPEPVQRATHALLKQSIKTNSVVYRCTQAEREAVPHHKRLENTQPGYGLPIGNLSSQFFANVYLDKLDQFIKHTLKAKRYLRYVDDFVLVHHNREQLAQWQTQIEAFLQRELHLKLKDDIRLKPLQDGIDFLGYVLYQTHTKVRKRVLSHCNEKLTAWAQENITAAGVKTTPKRLQELNAIFASYVGHFKHANALRLQQRIHKRYPWLQSLTSIKRRFDYRAQNQSITLRAIVNEK